MEKVTTASGKTFNCDMFSVITTPPRCYISLPGESFANAAKVFGDPNETAQLWYGVDYVQGFTSLQSISVDNNSIIVTLKRS